MSDYTPQKSESLSIQAAIREFGNRFPEANQYDYERFAGIYGEDVAKLMTAVTEGDNAILHYVFETGLIRLYARIAGRFAFLSNPGLRMNDDAT